MSGAFDARAYSVSRVYRKTVDHYALVLMVWAVGLVGRTLLVAWSYLYGMPNSV